jgi:type II secretory pathway pseudopilin PulG
VVSRRGESGYALLTALVVILLLAIALGLLAGSLQLRLRLVREDAENVLLSALSDAAVAETLAHLTQSPDYPGSPEREFGGGKIASRVLPLGAGFYNVVATATYGYRTRTVEAEVFRPPGKTARVRRWRRLRD